METRWAIAAVAVGGFFYLLGVGCGSRSGANDLLLTGGAGGNGAGGAGAAGPGPGPGPGPAPGPGPVGPGPDGGFGPGSGGFGPGAGGFGPGAGGGPGGAGGSPAIDCTIDVCTGGNVCCFDDDDPMGNFCSAPGTCPGSHIEVSCQNPSDCPGEICCGIYDFVGMSTGYEAVLCDPTCNPPEFDLDGIRMCGDDPSVCPGGPMDCLDSATLPDGFFYCDPN
jgi:hypothetical protein